MVVRPLRDKSECVWGVQTKYGIIPIIDGSNKFVMRWDTEFQIEGVEGSFTLNGMRKDGLVECEVHCYGEYDVELGWIKTMSSARVRKIIKEFKEHGFNVSEDAVRHNFDAWSRDLKSGYRDENGGYFLFTPCGHNPFSLNATTLCDKVDWQETYTC